jgi:FixJ family two-component response regulator
MTDDTARRHRILVVDDDAPVRRALARVLHLAGYDVCTLATGGELLMELGRAPAECVLLDIHLPDIAGVDLQGRIRALPNPPAVVLITADHDAARSRPVVRAGVRCLLKPLDETELLDAISGSLRPQTRTAGA